MASPWHRNVPERITEYLSAGGLFNPELMDHEKVRDILRDARDAILEADKFIVDMKSEPASAPETPRE